MQLALQREDTLLDEHVVPMFIAPPDVCREAGRTFFYGLVPTTSSERAEVGWYREFYDVRRNREIPAAVQKFHMQQSIQWQRGQDWP